MGLLGTRVPRREDPALLRGEGRFVADLVDASTAHVVYVTSTEAHALIADVDTVGALGPGVLGVYRADDLDLGDYPAPFPGMNPAMTRPFLARDRVRYVGEPIVAIVAETATTAVDAAAAVVVDYERLPVHVDPEHSRDAGFDLFPGIADPLAFRTEVGTPDLDPDVTGYEVVVRQRMVNQRMSAAPIEPRAGLARWEGDRLVHFSASQAVHENRALLATLYGIDPARVRVVSPDVGGSFGAKFRAYPEEALLGWFARELGRPVAWIETRTESMVSLAHGRAQVHHVTIGGRRDGTIECYHDRVVQDAGAYPLVGAFLPRMTQTMLTGVYAIPSASFVGESVVTNTAPVGAYRGAGRPEATAAIERAVDRFAAACGLDPVEVRRRNLIPADAFPHTTPSGAVYDSGDYASALDAALEQVGYRARRDEQRRRRAAGDPRALGIGVATYVEVTATTSAGDHGSVELHPDGRVTVRSGSTPHGQGHETVWAMIAADTLGIPMSAIDVWAADTDRVPNGVVTGGSRSAQVVGSMVLDAATTLVDRAREIAADLLEAAVADVRLDPDTGTFAVVGTPSRGVGWDHVAATLDTPIRIDSAGASDGQTFPFGAHVAVVEVDLETGNVCLERLVAVDDAGPVLHPAIFEGQIHGGLGGGAAQALLEEIRFDPDGNPLTTNFADYGVISAAELPSFELVGHVTPTPRNRLGVKGVGESGAVGSTAAIQNAVVDAVSHLGVDHIDLPLTAERVWRAIRDAGTPEGPTPTEAHR